MKNFLFFPSNEHADQTALIITEVEMREDDDLRVFINDAEVGDILKTSRGIFMCVGKDFPP